MSAPLSAAFFDRPPEVVAPDLLGSTLIHLLPDGQRVGGLILETEAYLPHGDPAAHSARGKTPLTAPQFMAGGTLYIHPMRQYVGMDIVTQGPELPGSVLIRALAPTAGLPFMHANRHTANPHRLTDGPGKLCQALGIHRGLSGQNVTDPTCAVTVYARPVGWTEDIQRTPRIGISKGTDKLLRFCVDKPLPR